MNRNDFPEIHPGPETLNDIDVEVPADHPQPLLWRVLIAPVKPKTMSRGGIEIPALAQEAQEYMNYLGKVVAVGDLAFKSEKFAGQQSFPGVGDFVIYGRYAGQKIQHRGVKLLVVNDDEILCVVSDPEALKIYI